ncbi:MAG: TonB-dependent receptor [Bacteroidota bacterium]|nr:TonB-dependent receptor [Bacteroidota bacterium]
MNFTHRLFILVFLLGIFLCGSVDGQINIKGTVWLSSTGKPLKGAHVMVKSTRSGSITDDNGIFSLTLPSKGSYTLRVTFVGCNPVEQQIVVNRSPYQVKDITLTEIPVLISEVDIVDKKMDNRYSNVPARMTMINQEMIRENPGLQITNVLDYISGVNLNTTTGIFGSDQVVSMRGLSGNDQGRTLILLDGVPLNKADGGSVNWNRINHGNLGEILVIRGPGPAKYGSNAMGGVIEMTSGRSDKVVSGTLSSSYGTFETFKTDYSLNGTVHPKGKRSGIFYNLNGFYTQSAGYNPEIPEYLTPADTFYTNTKFREAMIGGMTGYDFGNGQQVELGCSFYNDNRGKGIRIYESSGAYEQHKNYMLRFRYKGDRKNFQWDISGYYNREGFRRMNEFMSDAAYNLYLVKSERTDMGMTAGFTVKAGKYHTISAGAEYKKGSVYGQDIYYTSTDLVTNAGQIDLLAGYIQDEIKFSLPGLSLNLGLRYNSAVFHDGLFKVEYPSYSIEYLTGFQDTLPHRSYWKGFDPKLSFLYKFQDGSKVYVSIAKGFRAPNLDDLCRSGKISNGFRISNPSLGPENLYNIETGGETVLFSKVRLSGSVYYSIGNDFIYSVETGDSVNMGYRIAPVTQKRNISEVRIFGCEGEVEMNLTQHIRVNAGYSYSHSGIGKYQMTVNEKEGDLTGKSLTGAPDHKATAGITWMHRIVSLNILYKYVGRSWINDLNEKDLVLGRAEFPDYSTFGFRLWKTLFHKLTLAVDCDNLFNVTYIDDHCQRNPGRVIQGEVSLLF